MALKKNVRIWRGLAEDKLVEMASNLESGLKDDEPAAAAEPAAAPGDEDAGKEVEI